MKARFALHAAVALLGGGCVTARVSATAERVVARPGHVLFRVEPGQVEAAAQAFERAGFTVLRGGPPEDLVNAMIYFPDGWFIELFGLGPQPRVVVPLFLARFVDPLLAARFGRLVRSSAIGWVDWSIDVDDLGLARQILKGEVDLSAARTFERTQEDGSAVSWELSMPAAIEIPFLKTPYRGHRPIPASARVHRCGAKGLSGVVLSSADPDAARRKLRLLAEPSASGELRIAGVQVSVERDAAATVRRVLLCSAAPSGSHLSVEVGGGFLIDLVPCSLGTTPERATEDAHGRL